MHSRFLAGWKGLTTAVAVAGLVLLPAAEVFSAEKPVAKSGSGASSGFGVVKQDRDGFQRPLLYPRSNYIWPFATGPVYGEVDASRWSSAGVLHTAVGSFDLTRGLPNLPAELRVGVKTGQPSQYFILQVDPVTFGDGRFDVIRGMVTEQGGAVIEEMAVAGFLVRMNPSMHSVLRAQSGVLAVEPYHPAFKLAPTIGRAPLPDPVNAISDVYSLEVMLFPGESAQAVAQLISALGGNVTAVWDDVIKFDLHRNKLASVAGIEAVKLVFENLPNHPKGEETTTTMQTGKYNGGAIPYNDAGIRGDGGGIAGTSALVLMVLDSGLQLDAADLSNTRSSAGTAGAAHRKVKLYTTTSAFGGGGDSLGCDAPAQGGFTHGHVVSATALGNATSVLPAYGSGWQAFDTQNNPWDLDGVAPRAKLVLYDGGTTPSSLSCDDPSKSGINVGNVYTDNTPGSGSLGDAYTNQGARVFNFSWGSNDNPVYGTNAIKIDQFLFDNLDAMVFVSAGNEGDDTNSDGIPDPSTISDPATAKNAVVVGASGNTDEPDDGGNQEDFALFSSVGPATVASQRVAPILMAPGTDFGGTGGNMGMDSEFSCRSNDNDQSNPVECDTAQGLSGTSFSSPAAAGAALLVRDYFQQGFYPDGSSSNSGNSGDQVLNISGALVKSVLIASADWVGVGGALPGGGASKRYRFNHEQGYGRIQLNNALPLSSFASTPTGMIVTDGGISAGVNSISGLSGTMTGPVVQTETGTIKVNDKNQELRCALSWIEDQVDVMAHNLDLELQSPTGKIYFGNAFTEDKDKDGVLDTGEDCNADALIDNKIWNIQVGGTGQTCGTANDIARRDTKNPTEAVMLSPDPKENGIPNDPNTGTDEGADNQIELGDWQVKVIYRTGTGSQRYAVSCSGPVVVGSSVRFDQGVYVCNDIAKVTVSEVDEVNDPAGGLTVAEIKSRTTVQVIDVGPNGVFDNGGVDDIVRDSEQFNFTQPDPAALKFETGDIVLTDGTAYDPGNGALDVRSGNRLKVIYADEISGSPDPNKQRFNSASVNCQSSIQFGGIVWGQFGRDASTLINGGCERDGRGFFTFGFPDKYMDADEKINYRIAFQSTEPTETLEDAQASLRCVRVDANSPDDCKPGTTSCADPNRLDNPACGDITILDSPQTIGSIPPGAAISVNFNLVVDSAITGTPKIEMILGISARKSGKGVESIVVSRHQMDVDEVSIFYSTDHPTGATENRDYTGDEILQNPTTDPGDFDKDYRFETRVWGDLTAGGTKNTGINAPWKFDANNGGFTSGFNNISTSLGVQVVANWGEDRNFNNLLDAGEDRDPNNNTLDQGWNTNGGCGWQTKNTPASPTGGVWHTGRIDTTSLACSAQCELVDVISGFLGTLTQFELLLTPTLDKVTLGDDSDGDPIHTVEFVNWAWNMAIDLKTELDLLTWELDTDTQKLQPSDLVNDAFVLNLLGGPQGTLSGGNAPLTDGFQVFAPFSGTTSINGTQGNNREGKNPCLFETGVRDEPFSFAKPEDVNDPNTPFGVGDFDDDGDTLIDEFVTKNGPIRNFDITQANGPDMRFTTLEDIYGDSGNSFQGALGFLVSQGTLTQPSAGYGVAVDDVVIEWREFSLQKDTTNCAGGACATLSLAVTNVFEGNGILTATVLDSSPWNSAIPAENKNDCNGDGDYADVGDTQDCDGNGVLDVTVKAFSDAEPAGEVIVLNRTSNVNEYKGGITVSVAYDVPGVLFIASSGTSAATVTARYEDRNDGTGQRCQNDSAVERQGFVDASTSIFVDRRRVIVKSTRLTDNGDNDGSADTNETVDMFVTVANRSGVALDDVVVRLATNDPKIDCIIQPVVTFGALTEKQIKEGPQPFVFRVANVNRATLNEDFSAKFNVTISGGGFDTTTRAQEITLDLDLNFSGGGTSQTYSESFEVASGFNTFTSQSLDTGIATNTASDGRRCQYNDPDFINSNSFGNTYCFLGFPVAADNGFDWHVHQSTAVDGGRAYVGTRSLHWGVHLTVADNDTTRMKQLDAVRMTNPINLGFGGALVSELSFKHQIGITDFEYINAPPGEASDRAVVQIQLADSAGTAVGDWKKIFPYENLYDVQGTDQFYNCMFDPIDDGHNEDSYFDPNDPVRRLGPSSTCFPEFVFARQGNISFDAAFDANLIGRASDGPGLQGSDGPGTWVQPKFALDRYRGRRLRVRFLATTIEVENNVLFDTFFDWNPTPADDGWYIDDLLVTNTLSTPATVALDAAANSGLPGCGSTCTSVTANLVADPANTGAPGQVSELNAVTSTSDRCVDGVLQYQFWVDNDGDGNVGESGETLLRDWTDNPTFLEAPQLTTTYGVKVRCSSLTSCSSSDTAVVTVPCPSTGTAVGAVFPNTVNVAANKTTFQWGVTRIVDAIRGNLDTLRSSAGNFNGPVETCLANNLSVSSFSDATTPAVNSGKFYLVRESGQFCNAPGSWSTGTAQEAAGRDSEIKLDPDSCP